MRGPTAERIELDEAARNALEKLVRRYSTPQQIALRAQIVLQAAQGLSNSRIAEQLGTTRDRFAFGGNVGGSRRQRRWKTCPWRIV